MGAPKHGELPSYQKRKHYRRDRGPDDSSSQACEVRWRVDSEQALRDYMTSQISNMSEGK